MATKFLHALELMRRQIEKCTTCSTPERYIFVTGNSSGIFIEKRKPNNIANSVPLAQLKEEGGGCG